MLLLPSVLALLSSPSVLAMQDFALYLSESSSWADGELIWSKQAVPLATGPELTTSYLYKPSKVVGPAASSQWPGLEPGRVEWQQEEAEWLHMDATSLAVHTQQMRKAAERCRPPSWLERSPGQLSNP